MGRIYTKVVGVVASRWFLWGVLAVFAVEAMWFAFTYRLPMLFDEAYHLGIIQYYAQQWSPVISSQPVWADQFGDITHYPSFLYHYLMSFPYRLVSAATADTMAQVILLRLVNIGFMVAGLWCFVKVLRQLKLSPGLSHLVILLFALLPIVPMLAAQINYDNLLFALIALSLHLTLRIVAAGRLDFHTLAVLLLVNVSASMVKYTFLPVFAAEVLFLVPFLWRRRGRNVLADARVGMGSILRRATGIGLVLLIGVTGILFTYKYATNVVRYGTPSPECDQVLSVERCMAYGPWARNYQLAQSLPESGVSKSPVIFTLTWLKTVHTDFFRVAANTFPNNAPEYSTILPVVRLAATVMVLVALMVAALHWRVLYDSPVTRLMLTVVIVYGLVLWTQNYVDYIHTGERVGTQGRYLLPLLLPAVGILCYILSRTLRERQPLKVGMAALAVLLFLQGGGVTAGIVASQSSWYWQDDTVIQANERLKSAVAPFIRR